MNTERSQDAVEALERAVIVLRGMAYEHRLGILMLLRNGERTPADLAEALSTDTTSVAHHLRSLRDARLILRQRRGRNVYYTLRGEATERLVDEVLRYAGNSA